MKKEYNWLNFDFNNPNPRRHLHDLTYSEVKEIQACIKEGYLKRDTSKFYHLSCGGMGTLYTILHVNIEQARDLGWLKEEEQNHDPKR